MPKHLNISKLTIPDPGSRFKNVPVYCMIDLSYISTSHLQHIQIPVFGTQSREKWYREQSILGKVTRGLATLRGPAQYSTVQYSTVQYSTASVPQYRGPQPLPRPASTLAALTTIHSPAAEMGTWWILCRLCTDDCSFVSSCGLHVTCIQHV